MSVESGWGSSSWGLGRWGEESNVDAASAFGGTSTLVASAGIFIPGASAISASATVAVAGSRIHRPEAEISGTASVAGGARKLWVPQPASSTSWAEQSEDDTAWTKQVA